MSEAQEPVAKPKKKRRRRSTAPRGPIEVRAMGKRYYAYSYAYASGGLMLTLRDHKVLLPIIKPIEIYEGMVEPLTEPRRVAYDPQLPHNQYGNLSMDELEKKERQREQELKAFADDRKAELDALANGATPFVPRFVGQG